MLPISQDYGNILESVDSIGRDGLYVYMLYSLKFSSLKIFVDFAGQRTAATFSPTKFQSS